MNLAREKIIFNMIAYGLTPKAASDRFHVSYHYVLTLVDEFKQQQKTCQGKM